MSLTALRWSVVIVLGGGAALLLLHGHPALPAWLGAALAAVELAGAVLFAVPATVPVGAAALIAALVAAAAIHIALGQPPPPAYAVHAAAIWVVVARRAGARAGGTA
jgi:hypothetical protein